MRIISGKYKGLILKEYNVQGTRPTMDRIRESLFAMINKLKSQGIGIIYISHKMDEIFEICDEKPTVVKKLTPLTLNKEFEARQIRSFAKMALDGMIFQGLKPIYWSPYQETAIADSEIVYIDRKDIPKTISGITIGIYINLLTIFFKGKSYLNNP